MDLREIEKHAKALMTLHGVGHVPFKFTGGKRQIGVTMFRQVAAPTGRVWVPLYLGLSRHYAVLLREDEIEETILHEIAHIKAGHLANHGPAWVREARALGIKGNRCKAASAKPEAPIKGYCTKPGCGKIVSNMHRLPLRVYYHKGCGLSHPLRWEKNGVVVPWHDMPARYVTEYARKFSTTTTIGA